MYKVILDIWGGHNHQQHVARFILSLEEALEKAKEELKDGYLVNIRTELAWGEYRNFDLREN